MFPRELNFTIIISVVCKTEWNSKKKKKKNVTTFTWSEEQREGNVCVCFLFAKTFSVLHHAGEAQQHAGRKPQLKSFPRRAQLARVLGYALLIIKGWRTDNAAGCDTRCHFLMRQAFKKCVFIFFLEFIFCLGKTQRDKEANSTACLVKQDGEATVLIT